MPEDGPGVEKLLREEGVEKGSFSFFLSPPGRGGGSRSFSSLFCFFFFSHSSIKNRTACILSFVAFSHSTQRDVRGRDARHAQGAARGRARQDGEDGEKKNEEMRKSHRRRRKKKEKLPFSSSFPALFSPRSSTRFADLRPREQVSRRGV